MNSRIEIFLHGQWVPAADIRQLGADRCTVDYLPDYIFADGAVPIALGLPLEFMPHVVTTPDGGGLEYLDRRPAPFLFDLVPQGKGRKLLLALLNLQDSDNMLLPLLLNGAFNPIGNLRIDSALKFYGSHKDAGEKEQKSAVLGSSGGFSMEDMLRKSEGFLDHLSLHSLLAAGTTGVQGVAPKFLLAKNSDGRWFADMALPDAQTREHWIVKLPRGRAYADRAVLRNEAAYLLAARACGLRVEADPMLVGEMLFVKRFDRQVGANGLVRLHQESLASVAGLRGFAPSVDQATLLKAIRLHASDPLCETIEFLKRDALNMALRNTDNHARNTALQRLEDGFVRLTPLYDFAPMFMDPEIIPRNVHWVLDGGRVTQWSRIIEQLEVPDGEKSVIAEAMKEFSEVVAGLIETGPACGIEPLVMEQCSASIERVATDLSRIDAAQCTQGLKGENHGKKTKRKTPGRGR